MVTVVFLIVQGEVLDGRHHPLGLDALYIIDGSTGGQVGILAHIFEIPSAKRAAVDVDARSQEYVHSPGAGILAQSHTHLPDKGLVPAGRSCHTAGEKGAAGVVAHALGAVRHTDLRYAEALYPTNVEFVISAYIVDLLAQSHLADQFAGAVTVFLCNALGKDSSCRSCKKRNCK